MGFKAVLVLTVASATLAGCAHGIMRGSVAMKTSENEAHVCLGNGEVKPGDRVQVFRNVCPGKGPNIRASSSGAFCRKEGIGLGTVAQVLNEHYSVVKFDPGVPFEEGTLIEKQ